MGELQIEEPDDERLRQLLAVEKRLRDLVQAATDDAARRVAAARAAGERRIVASRDEAARADAEKARTQRVLHAESLTAIHDAHQARLAGIESLSDEHVDELANWVLVQAIAGTGEQT